MANPNSEIWRDPENWIYSKQSAGLTSELSQTINADRPKTTSFGGTDNENIGALVRGVSNNYIIENNPLDMTICPCGQDPFISPWGKYAICSNFNNITTPTQVVTETNNINWFFADFTTNPSPLLVASHPFSYSKTETTFIKEQWSPNADNETSPVNGNYYLSPYMKWGLRSIVLQIWVKIIPKGAENDTTGALWTTLESWKTSYSTTYDCAAMNLFHATTSSINSSTHELTYHQRSDTDPSSSYKSGQVCYFKTLNIDGVDTQFLNFNILSDSINNRSSIIFGRPYANMNNKRVPVLPCWDMFDGMEIKYYGDSTSKTLFYVVPYSEKNYEKMLKISALFGCFFTPTAKYQFAYEMTDNDLYLPIIDDDGVAHGEYTRGVDNASNPLYEKNSIREIDYDPTKPPAPYDHNTYSNITGFNSISGGASMTKRYVLDKANVDKLADDLWTISSELAQVQGNLDYDHFEAKVIDNFLVTSPIDAIVSLKRYPFDVPHTFSNNKEPVKLGKNTATAEGYTSYNVFNTVQFAGVDIYKRFGGCFLDYEPYTCYELYVPFCGTTKLQASDIIGHTLNLRMQIDLLTGTCTAYIMADSLVIETTTGSCGCDLQVTGTDTTYMNSAIVSAVTNAQSAKANKVIADTSTMTPAGLVGAFINPWKTAASRDIANANMYKADYELQHIQTPLHSMGTSSALTGWCQEFDARIIIYYPEGDVIQSSIPPSFNKAALKAFGHTKGFGTVTPGTVSSFHGYTQGTIIADQIPCTESERNRIKEAFASGVFLP